MRIIREGQCPTAKAIVELSASDTRNRIMTLKQEET